MLDKIIKVLNDHNLITEIKMCDKDITGITYNSKEVLKDNLFICKGFNFKEEYLNEAIEKGCLIYVSCKKYNDKVPYIIVNDERASLALIAKEYYKIDKPLKKIGITGTKGKTTTVFFLHNILNAYQKTKTAYLSTIDYYTGKSSGNSNNTTPESLDLYKYFNEISSSNLNEVVMEVSSQATKLKRIYEEDFLAGAFLNIGLDHISEHEHKDFDDYLNCKIEFLKQCQNVFIFKETSYFDRVVNEVKDKKIYTFGFSSCDYKISEIENNNNSTSFKVNDKKYVINMKGEFNIINATCAIAIADLLNISYENIYNGLINTHVPGRMEIINDFICPIIVDYAHNKLSIETLIKETKKLYPNHSLKLVMGLPGNKSQNRRCELGSLASNFKTLYLTSDNPNNEQVLDICMEIAKYIKDNNYLIIEDRTQAITKCLKEATKDDVILVLGKGDELYQVVNGKNVLYEGDINICKRLVKEYYGKN